MSRNRLVKRVPKAEFGLALDPNLLAIGRAAGTIARTPKAPKLDIKGVAGLAGSIAAPLSAAISKGNIEKTGTEQGVEAVVSGALSALGPKGQIIDAGLKVVTSLTDKFKKEAGKDRFGNKLINQDISNKINPITGLASNIDQFGKLIGGKQSFNTTMDNIMFGSQSKQFKKLLKEGEQYRNRLTEEQTLVDLNKSQSTQRSKQLQRDQMSAGFGTMFAKKGGTLPCGCSKDKDGLDTDVFNAMPKALFNMVLEKINLPENTQYNDKVKNILKNSVKEGQSLREYVDAINPKVKQFIKYWESNSNR